MKALFGSSSAREDLLEEITDFPLSSIGAPIPVVLSDELQTFLCYYVENLPEGWDGTAVTSVGADTVDEAVAIVTFKACKVHKFGPPNDEAISGHPLYKKGLKPYRVFKVLSSSWIAELEKINSVHPYHDKKRFDGLSHFIFGFKDSTFECVAETAAFEVRAGSMRQIVQELVGRL
jgi:hypothetical protein